MVIEDAADGDRRRLPSYHFDRHTAEYRQRFETIAQEILARCPLAWTDTYGGHWVTGGSHAVFELARSPDISNDTDVDGVRRGYQGITSPRSSTAEGGDRSAADRHPTDGRREPGSACSRAATSPSVGRS